MKIATVAGIALLSTAAWWNIAQAQVAYTNAALNGCYAHLATSVDTGSNTVGRDEVGTICFDGNGNILGNSGKPGLSGHVSNTEGSVHVSSDNTGTYSVTNFPGDGMGLFIGKCGGHTANSCDGCRDRFSRSPGVS